MWCCMLHTLNYKEARGGEKNKMKLKNMNHRRPWIAVQGQFAVDV